MSAEDSQTGGTVADPSSKGAAKARPKYREIADGLEESIAQGKYQEGARLPSEAELVRRFGVSRMTVVKAMQHLKHKGVLVRRTGSGSFASSAAGKGNGQRPVFGLLIPDLGDTEIFESICKGLARSSDSDGHSLSWGHSFAGHANKEEEAEHLCRQYIEQKIAGVFFAPLEFSRHRDQVNQRILKALRVARIPVVLLDRCVMQYPSRSEYDVVGLDNRRAGFVMTDHLIRRGARRLGFLAESNSAETVDDRLAGFREALFAHRLPVSEESLLRSEGTDLSGVDDVLKRYRFDAIVCANDLTAARLMRLLLSKGYRIPEEVRIAGVDDVKYAALLPVPLTTFHQPCLEIGAAAVAAMKERISHPELPGRSIMLNGYLVVRQSCGPEVAG